MTAPNLDAVPQAMKDARQWRVYREISGKKPPCDPRTGDALSNWQDPENDLTFRATLAALGSNGRLTGAGFNLANGFGGLDLDNCRDISTGEVDPRALAVLSECCPGAYVEISPSGLGLKAFGQVPHGADVVWLELTFRKGGVDVRQSGSGYFTVTGRVFRDGGVLDRLDLGTAAATFGRELEKEKRDAAKQLPAVVLPGAQNSTLFSEMCRLRQRGYSGEEIFKAAWALVEGGRFPPEREPWTQREVERMAQRVAERYQAGADDFERDKAGKITNTTANHKRAFRALGARPRRNRFTGLPVVERDGREVNLDDEVMRGLRFEAEQAFGWKPPAGDFSEVAYHLADTDDFHPVRDYLDSLVWDGVKRVDLWLADYAGAMPTNYVLAVGRLVLVAAVRRVRRPGEKFDELLVLESPQGLDKSNLLRRLCPRADWFSETLTLADTPKETIERTSGTWIAEAAEMVGNRREVDRLKAFLSTSVDGPVRLAYAKEPVKVPRQFVVVGTTNHAAYLRDLTGGRRFWPVTLGKVDLAALERDRDQLWAEAARLEAEGAPTRLDSKLWAEAAAEQEDRRVADPWEEALSEALGAAEGKVLSARVWQIVAVPMERRTQDDNGRLGRVMQKLGFKRLKSGGKIVYARGGEDGRERPWIPGCEPPKGDS